ncbi:MAG: DHHA1 domain-containing protein [Terriglobales bacterium]
MTERLYYRDSLLYEFDAEVLDTVSASDSDLRTAIILDRTAFYPTSGGQVFDTGAILPVGTAAPQLRVAEVAQREDGTILHILHDSTPLPKGTRVRGLIDPERRRDHMQQHSGQHILSAAFVRLFDTPTVSFHMGADYCSIDLDTKGLNPQQIEAAEALANAVVQENRPVEIRFVTQEEARELGLRKLPPIEKDELRLIDIRDFDLTACGGTHVQGTAQIGCILLRKTEKVRQGWRVEFVCGKRAISTARRDYTTLSDAAAALSAQLWDVPQQIQKLQKESRASQKSREQLHEEMAGLHAERMLSETQSIGERKIITGTFPDRDLSFIKLLAQKLTRQSPSAVALLSVTSTQPALVFAQSPGQPFDMGTLMQEALAKLGGRGGGTKDMAQGGPAQVDAIETTLREIAERLRTHAL